MPATRRNYLAVASCSDQTFTGLRSSFNVANLGSGNQRAVWSAMQCANGYWIQFGYTSIKKGNQFFAWAFNLGTGPVATLVATYTDISALTITTGMVPQFTLQNIGTTIWRLDVDGTNIWDYDFHSDTATLAQCALEKPTATNEGSFPTITFNPAMKLYQGAAWVDAPHAFPNSQDYGIEGSAQNSALADNVLRMGSSIAIVSPLAYLWTV